jgi:hypothetical protein
MKTSNYIFSVFLIFLFGGILLLFIGAKFYKGVVNEDNSLTQEKPLNTFSVVVAETEAYFILKNGAQNKISQRYLKDLAPNFAPFTVRNDTLFVYSVKKEDSNKQEHSKGGYFIIVPEISCQNVKSIVAKENSTVRMYNFQADTLRVDLNGTKLNSNFKKIASIFIEAKNSDINFEGENLEKLAVKLDKTQLRVRAKKRINNLSGSLKNQSDCSFSLSKNINLDADQTSVYSFYNIVY